MSRPPCQTASGLLAAAIKTQKPNLKKLVSTDLSPRPSHLFFASEIGWFGALMWFLGSIEMGFSS
jgi:hypothetical protein